MKFTLALLPLLGLALSTPVPASEPQNTCFVPMSIMTTLGNPFTIQLSSTNPKVNLSPLTYRLSSGFIAPGIYSDSSSAWSTTLQDGALSLAKGRGTAFIVEPRDKPAFRQVGFKKNVKVLNAAQYEAYYRCINGKSHLVIRPGGKDAGQVFCVYKVQKGYTLWVKPTNGEECIEVIAMVIPGVKSDHDSD
ncbi:hypothetical protein BDD12DRAFT_372316 [Trichophaea hybrida]|nr:hypothetical protein BDD12DRAFT_372316 [Trichophaea hybrida]